MTPSEAMQQLEMAGLAKRIAPIKALTISQPFASLIASGEKWVENRCWPTRYRGPLAIHAGKGTQYLTRKELQDYPTGCIVAVAKSMHCVSYADVQHLGAMKVTNLCGVESGHTWKDVMLHKHTEGPFCWVLGEVIQLDEPIPATGKQGLWDCACPITL